jgi:hypothetical protein
MSSCHREVRDKVPTRSQPPNTQMEPMHLTVPAILSSARLSCDCWQISAHGSNSGA